MLSNKDFHKQFDDFVDGFIPDSAHDSNFSLENYKLKELHNLYTLFIKCSVECGLVSLDKDAVEVTQEFFDIYSKEAKVEIKKVYRTCIINGVMFVTVLEAKGDKL